MGRRYIVSEPNFALQATGAMDLLQIKGASNKVLRIIRWWCRMASADSVLPSAQTITVRCRHLPATVTDGSGGATPTPRPVDGGDAAATFTALSKNTTKATTNGTARILDEGGFHIYNGYEQGLEECPIVPPSTSFVFECTNTAIVGTVNVSVGAEVEEIG